MIRIKTQTGCWMDSENSEAYIQYEINDRFSSFHEYAQEMETFENPDYWGEYILDGSENEYKSWITKIVNETLLK